MDPNEYVKLCCAVDKFADAMKLVLKEKMNIGYRGWNKKSPPTDVLCLQANKDTVEILKGHDIVKHCVDVANRMMMVWYRLSVQGQSQPIEILQEAQDGDS